MGNVALPGNPASLGARGFRQTVRWVGSHPMLCAAAFFMFSLCLRLICNSRMGPLVLTIPFDESRYLHLARSIAGGGPPTVWGGPTDFQKILYPLVISPAFLLARDPLAQMKIVGIINCLVMSSMVFPVALLTSRLTPKPSVLLFTLAFAVMLPDFAYTATIMSEPLYWPLSIWAFYLFHEAMAEKEQRKRLLWFAVFGTVTYLAYLTKETGAAWLIAAAAMLLYEGMRDRRRLKQNAISLAVSAAAFFTLFLILKLTLFRGMGNSYNSPLSDYDHLSLDVLKYPELIFRLFYSTAALMLAAILSFYVLPLLLPLFHFKMMDREKQRIYLFSALSLAIVAGAIAFTSSIRVAVGNRVPNLHLRMLAPMAVPFMILCFDILISKDNAAQRGKRKKRKKLQFSKQTILVLTMVFCALPLFLLPIVPESMHLMDHASLAIANLVYLVRHLSGNVSSGAELWFLYKAFLLAIMAAGSILFLKEKRKPLLALLLCAIFAVSVTDNSLSYRMIRVYKRFGILRSHVESGSYLSNAMAALFSEETVPYADRMADAAISVSNFLQQLDHAPEFSVIVCMEIENANYIWTYSPPNLRIYALFPELGLRCLALPGYAPVQGLKDETANYMIVKEDFNPFTNVEVIFRRAPFLVLRNLDPAGWYSLEEPS